MSVEIDKRLHAYRDDLADDAPVELLRVDERLESSVRKVRRAAAVLVVHVRRRLRALRP